MSLSVAHAVHSPSFLDPVTSAQVRPAANFNPTREHLAATATYSSAALLLDSESEEVVDSTGLRLQNESVRKEHEEVPVAAIRAAHAVVTIALEVIDRRRPLEKAKAAFAPALIDMLGVVARRDIASRALGAARIHRVHVHGSGFPPGGTGLYEVCATYARGPRLFAIAARIQVLDRGARCVAFRFI